VRAVQCDAIGFGEFGYILRSTHDLMLVPPPLDVCQPVLIFYRSQVEFSGAI